MMIIHDFIKPEQLVKIVCTLTPGSEAPIAEITKVRPTESGLAFTVDLEHIGEQTYEVGRDGKCLSHPSVVISVVYLPDRWQELSSLIRFGPWEAHHNEVVQVGWSIRIWNADQQVPHGLSFGYLDHYRTGDFLNLGGNDRRLLVRTVDGSLANQPGNAVVQFRKSDSDDWLEWQQVLFIDTDRDED
ncbi:MAG: hypothetical protein ABIB97_00495 [Patescibacteria group bacterium]